MSLQFAEMHEQQGRSILLTPQQEQWLTIQRMIAATDLKQRHQPPTRPWRRAVYGLVFSQGFEWATLGLILANMLVLATPHVGMSQVGGGCCWGCWAAVGCMGGSSNGGCNAELVCPIFARADVPAVGEHACVSRLMRGCCAFVFTAPHV